jgi:hydroxyacylglutathione hydrolase
MTEAPVHRITIPNPFFEGATNVYVIAAEPLTLIDTGIGTEEAWTLLKRGLEAHGLRPESIRQIVLTHHHLDHIGQAHRIREASGARVFVHADDWEGVAHYEDWHNTFVQRLQQRLHEWRTPAAIIQASAAILQKGGSDLACSTPAERLTDGQRLPVGGGDLEVIHTPGHSRGSMCLLYGRYLFSGDHVLPNVSPNIGGGELVVPGMLRRYIESLERVRRLQAKDLLVLPGHGEPFSDLETRVQALQEHHREREEEIIAFLRAAGPKTVYEIALFLFGSLHGYHVVLGTGETHAHLEKLVSEERLVFRDGRFGTKGKPTQRAKSSS